MMKRITLILLAAFLLAPSAYALNREEAIFNYSQELSSTGIDPVDAGLKAERDVTALVDSMITSKSEVETSFTALEERVDSLLSNDGRKDSAESALDVAENKKDAFVRIDPNQNIDVLNAVGGALPRVIPSSAFKVAETEALDALSTINRIMISPAKPGLVPEGDIISDFIPQIVRQLFRFAWLAIFVAFTVSGVMLIIAQGDEESITKARGMIYYTLMGFAFIALAFALVKGVTDIDFFRFI